MDKKRLKRFLSDLVDLGEEVSFHIHVGQFHEPSFKPRTKTEAEALRDKMIDVLGDGVVTEKKEHGDNTYSFVVRKGLNHYFSFAYKEVAE